MEDHYILTDKEFEKQFSAGTLEERLFSHEAHLRLAWIHIENYGVEVAIANICHQLQTYVRIVGADDKYNKTLTVAAVKAIHHFRQKSKSNSFKNFISEFPRLNNNFRELIGTHYRIDIFNSPLAKKQYLKPDLEPFS